MKKSLVLFLFVFSSVAVFAQTNYVITSADGVRINVNEHGSGRPVLLLAGGPGLNARYLQPIWQTVTRYRFVVPDQRGTGGSTAVVVDSANFTVDKYIADLEALRVHLGLSKFVIVGHSWGGMLAYAYAARYPERVERLVLLDPGGITPAFFAYFGDNVEMRLRPEDLEEQKHTSAGGIAEAKALWPGNFFSRERALATKSHVDSTTESPAAGAIENFAVSDYSTPAHVAARIGGLKNYRGAVTIIQGRQDPVGESTAYEAQRILPQTKLFFIERSGHFPWLEEEKALKEFYQRLNAALGE